MEEKEPTEETGLGPILWTVGDIAKAIGVAIGIVLVIAFALGIGTLLLIGPGALEELASQDFTFAEFINLLTREGVFQLWMVILLVGMVVGEGAMPLAAWLFSALKYRCGWRALGFRPFKVRRGLVLAALVVLIGLLISFLYDMLMSALGVEPSFAFPAEFTETGLGLAVLAVIAVVVAPVAEETFFRGFIFAGLGKRFGYGWGAVISALLFSLAHMQPGAFLPIFILGLFLAWLYMRTGSIWPCIFTHFTYNSLALLIMII